MKNKWIEFSGQIFGKALDPIEFDPSSLEPSARHALNH